MSIAGFSSNHTLKKVLVVCYSGSGIKTLKVLAKILLVFAILGIVLIFVGMIVNYENQYTYRPSLDGDLVILFGISTIITGSLLSPVFKALATIAETALIKKHIIQSEYDFMETDKPEKAGVLHEEVGSK